MHQAQVKLQLAKSAKQETKTTTSLENSSYMQLRQNVNLEIHTVLQFPMAKSRSMLEWLLTPVTLL